MEANKQDSPDNTTGKSNEIIGLVPLTTNPSKSTVPITLTRAAALLIAWLIEVENQKEQHLED